MDQIVSRYTSEDGVLVEDIHYRLTIQMMWDAIERSYRDFPIPDEDNQDALRSRRSGVSQIFRGEELIVFRTYWVWMFDAMMENEGYWALHKVEPPLVEAPIVRSYFPVTKQGAKTAPKLDKQGSKYSWVIK